MGGKGRFSMKPVFLFQSHLHFFLVIELFKKTKTDIVFKILELRICPVDQRQTVLTALTFEENGEPETPK